MYYIDKSSCNIMFTNDISPYEDKHQRPSENCSAKLLVFVDTSFVVSDQNILNHSWKSIYLGQVFPYKSDHPNKSIWCPLIERSSGRSLWQGSCPSYTLFLVYIMDMEEVLDLVIALYAENLVLWVTCPQILGNLYTWFFF